MNKLNQIIEAIEALPDSQATVTAGNVLWVADLKLLADHVRRCERLLAAAVYIEFDQWVIYNNFPFAKKPGDGKIRLFKKNETNQSFDVRDFESVLEAYEGRQTFESRDALADGEGE